MNYNPFLALLCLSFGVVVSVVRSEGIVTCGAVRLRPKRRARVAPRRRRTRPNWNTSSTSNTSNTSNMSSFW
eukprot:s500_g15.t1